MSGPAPGGDAEERVVRLVHDLRTPLTVIAGFAELLERQRDRLTDEQRDEYIARIAASARELSSILDSERDDRLSGG
jgi:signal transduction histidine kinase